MSSLDNPYIIRMIGLCKSDWMLILEYAPLGPLKGYLRRHRRSAMRRTYSVADLERGGAGVRTRPKRMQISVNSAVTGQ